MQKPRDRFLRELEHALREAEHKNVAEHMMAGAMWAMYPEWWEKVWVPRHHVLITCDTNRDTPHPKNADCKKVRLG